MAKESRKKRKRAGTGSGRRRRIRYSLDGRPNLRRRHAPRQHQLPGSQADSEAGAVHLGGGVPRFRQDGEEEREGRWESDLSPTRRHSDVRRSAKSPSAIRRTFGCTTMRSFCAGGFATWMGFPVGDPEIVFKFRHPDEKAAAELDVRPKVAGQVPHQVQGGSAAAEGPGRAATVSCTRTTASSD